MLGRALLLPIVLEEGLWNDKGSACVGGRGDAGCRCRPHAGGGCRVVPPPHRDGARIVPFRRVSLNSLKTREVREEDRVKNKVLITIKYKRFKAVERSTELTLNVREKIGVKARVWISFLTVMN